MSTNSTVSMVVDQKVVSVYGHWDGYLDGVGATLNEFYLDREAVMSILDEGDFSSLDRNSFDAPPGHSFENPVDGNTVFYGRDRGEEGCGARVLESLDDLQVEYPSAEYDYVFVDGEGWFYRQRYTSNTFQKLIRAYH